MDEMRGPGRALLASILLGIGGILNVIYGIAAIGHSKFFVDHPQFVFGNLKAWGWAALIIGVAQLFGSVSLIRGHTYGRWVGIIVGSLAAIEALLEIPAYPFWSLAVFALSIYIVHGLTLGDHDDVWESQPGDRPMMMSRPRPLA
jgi:hypothetical protein